MKPTDDEHERFEALFRACAPRVHAYARRHVEAPLVEEIVAETFLVAWRRRDAVPLDDPVPWLLVAARHTVANTRRRASRAAATPDLRSVAGTVPGVDGAVVERAVALAALATLTDREREAVLLVAWDGLDPRDAAKVAGCSTRALTVRLHRARQRLDRPLDDEQSGDAPSRAVGTGSTHNTPRPITTLTQENR